MDIRAKKEAKGLLVSMVGRLDSVSVEEFNREMNDWIKNGELNIILDLSRLDYISSAGLRSILAASKRLKENKGTITLRGLQGGVKEVFDISGFSSLFTIDDEVGNGLGEKG